MPRWLTQFRLSIRAVFHKTRVEQELDEELQDHLQREMDEAVKRGVPPSEARYAALRAMGAISSSKEECRDMRRVNFIDDFWRDLRYAGRSLRRTPGFTVLAVLIMALGIGANTAVFSVVNAVVLKPLAFNEPDRIVTLLNTRASGAPVSGLGEHLISLPNLQDWHDQSSSFAAMAYYSGREVPVKAGATAEYVRLSKTSEEFFDVFSVKPILGRLFEPAERKGLEGQAVLISFNYWHSHFAGDPGALGRTIPIGNASLRIVGVLPSGFRFPSDTDLWYPAGPINRPRYSQNDFGIGRLKPGVPIERAQTELSTIGARLAAKYPETNKDKSVTITRLQDDIVGDMTLTLYLLWGAVSVVLLIACANTATLLLGKATVRAHEIAVRAALGASRTRVVRQLITESLLLAMGAGALGLLMAQWGAQALVALAPGLPRLDETKVDWWVLAFTLGVSLVTSLIFGLVPALYAAKVDLKEAMAQSGTRSVTGGATRLRGALVVGEIALAVVLLSGAGLLTKSLLALENVDLGFRPENVLVIRATSSAAALERNLFFKDMIAEIAAVPGVLAVGATMQPPGSIQSTGPFYADALPTVRDPNGPSAVMSVVTPGSFAALGTPLLHGRDFGENDIVNRPMVAIINETLARTAFGKVDPVGRTVFCAFDSSDPMTVIGVAADFHQGGPDSKPIPQCFLPYRQHAYNGNTLSFLVRTAGDPVAMTDTIRRVARGRAPDVPVQFTTMETIVSENVALPRFRTLLFGLFATLAVCLAMAGIYGVMAYAVGQRSSEIGLRIALGATTGSVLRLVIQQGLVLAGVGLVVGLAASAGLTRLLKAMLFEVQPNDPGVYFGVSLLLGVVILLACYIPAQRAARIDPVTAMRRE